MKSKNAAKAMKARKAKKVAGATSAKRTKIRSLKSLIDASSERQCYLSARHNACHIWKQKIGMHLNKWRFELGLKKEALQAHKRVAKMKTTVKFEKEKRARSRGTTESEERHCQQRIKYLIKSEAEWTGEATNIMNEISRESEKENKLTRALEKLGVVVDHMQGIGTQERYKVAEPPAKRQKRQKLDDVPQMETAAPPSTASTTADSQETVGRSATRQSDDEPLGNPALTPPSLAVCDWCGDTGHCEAVGTFPSDLFAGPSPGHRLPDQTKGGNMVRGSIPRCGVRSVPHVLTFCRGDGK